MIIVIRISGLVEVPTAVQESLFRIHLRKKYTATLVEESEENISLLKKLRNFTAYGKIDSETLEILLQKRGQLIDRKKKINIKEASAQLGKKTLVELGFKPFFRLHPPRGGIDSKMHFPIRKGVLGDNQDKIKELVRRML